MFCEKSKFRIVSGILSTFLLIFIISTVFFVSSNKRLKVDADKARLLSDSLLSEKLLLDREIAGLKMELNTISGKEEYEGEIKDTLDLTKNKMLLNRYRKYKFAKK